MSQQEITLGLAILASAFAEDAPTRNASVAIRTVTDYAHRR